MGSSCAVTNTWANWKTKYCAANIAGKRQVLEVGTAEPLGHTHAVTSNTFQEAEKEREEHWQEKGDDNIIIHNINKSRHPPGTGNENEQERSAEKTDDADEGENKG